MIRDSVEIGENVEVGEGCWIWDFTQIRNGASIGTENIIGRGVYIGSGVSIGSKCKIQNSALLYEPAVIRDGVFIGPGVVFTNDLHPRAVTSDMRLKSAIDWSPVGVTVLEGASIGARSVCIAPVKIGRWAMVGAGSVVTRDVPDFGLVLGSPARLVGWVGKSGHRLQQRSGNTLKCPVSGSIFKVMSNGQIVEVEVEDQ